MIYNILELANNSLPSPLVFNVGSVFDANMDADNVEYPCLFVENTSINISFQKTGGTSNAYNVTLYFLDKSSIDSKVVDLVLKLNTLEEYIKDYIFAIGMNKSVLDITGIRCDVQYKLFDSVSCGWLVTFTLLLKDNFNYNCTQPY